MSSDRDSTLEARECEQRDRLAAADARERDADARKRAADQRDRAADLRDAAADTRDAEAARRDTESVQLDVDVRALIARADARDPAAEARDRAADERDKAFESAGSSADVGTQLGQTFADRFNSGTDWSAGDRAALLLSRDRAAERLEAAGAQRQDSALDRVHPAAYRLDARTDGQET